MLCGHDIEDHLSYKWGIPHRKLGNLTWDDFNWVMKSYKKNTKSKITKLFHNQWPTMEREFRWNRNKSDICPLCNLTPETKHNFFQCASDMTTIPRNTSINLIIAFPKSSKTHSSLVNSSVSFSNSNEISISPLSQSSQLMPNLNKKSKPPLTN